MTDSRVAVGLDRLPWLDDEPKARAKLNLREFLGWAVAAMLIVAGVAYWLGTKSGQSEVPEAPIEQLPKPMTTMRLPEPRTETVTRDVTPIPVPEPKLVVPVRRERTAPAKRVAPPPAKQRVETPAALATPAPTPARPVAAVRYPTLWPSRQTKGAYGRIVQIGAFGSRIQAKRGWTYMVRAYPAVRRLPAVVVETRNSRGRRFYRFQIGTTSQAHSEILCQRMQKIRLSCAVVGLPWKPKGVER